MTLTKGLGGGTPGSLTVKDEGTTLTTSATSIDFVGAGVTATNVGGAVTATIASGALVFLGAVTASASSSADFTSLISSTYDDYELVWEGVIVGTANQAVGIQLSADNGSSWITSGYRYGRTLFGVSANFSGYVNATAQPSAPLAGNQLHTSIVSAGITKLYRANTSERKFFVSEGVLGAQDGNTYGIYCTAEYPTSTTFNAIRVIADSGTLTGVFRLYGRAKV